ncbi:unnamed protein product [Clonostachys rosea f. rosea IK726]|uniref:Uncharacterized protein n=1 Tax=Clonostachys rosea f. rosea IK726 TaxID=1349383 RepID=A0ACA9U151_BIOOC|nr:unnamed protein product [Clonostachys rosea f. rosea IK726]
MHRDAIQVWIQTIAATSPFHDPAFAADEQSRILAGIDDASLNKAKLRSNLYSTSSPSKRQQLRDVPDDVATDPETAPRRPQRENRVHITDESPAPSFAHGEMPPQQSDVRVHGRPCLPAPFRNAGDGPATPFDWVVSVIGPTTTQQVTVKAAQEGG